MVETGPSTVSLSPVRRAQGRPIGALLMFLGLGPPVHHWRVKRAAILTALAARSSDHDKAHA